MRERFDKIFFTGSTRVGRVVMAAAAKHLTPVTLELGGKCPAHRVRRRGHRAGGTARSPGENFMNAGQTCVAPDFVLVQRGVRAAFRDRAEEITAGILRRGRRARARITGASSTHGILSGW